MYGIGSRTISGSIMGTLLWPITSSVIGSLLHKFKWVQQNFPDTFQRNILGGYLFVMVKDISNLWYRYEKVRQYRSRRVMGYKEIKKA
jgi:hypothetical protein